MTKKILQGLATGIFFTTSILSYNFYFTDHFQIENEVASFSEQDLQAYLDENDLVTINQTEYEQLLTKVEKIDTQTAKSETINQDVEAKEITIIIKAGMSSGAVGLLLEENGLIGDDRQFTDYLLNNQLETKIKAGEYQLSTGLTVKEIAETLS